MLDGLTSPKSGVAVGDIAAIPGNRQFMQTGSMRRRFFFVQPSPS